MYRTGRGRRYGEALLRLYREHRKFAVGLAAIVGCIAVPTFTGDHIISIAEWGNVVYAGLGAIAIWGMRNDSHGVWAYAKTIIEGMTAIAVLTLSIVTQGQLFPGEWWQFVVLSIATVGVGRVPNQASRESDT